MADQPRTERPGDIDLQSIAPSSPQPDSAENADEDTSSGLARKIVFQLVAAGFSYFFAGTNDGSLGAVTPYILRTYNVGTQYVAIMYGQT